MTRKTAQVETRLLSEYLLATYSKYSYIISVPLGKLDETLLKTLGYKQAMGLSRPYRPSVDAVVILPNYLIIIEAKVWNILNGLGKLPMYKSLVPFTPELQQYMPREVIMELVVAWTNANLEIMAREAGVTVRVFCPDWMQEVVNKMHNYWTKEYRESRERKLEARRLLGVE